jgi:hypothetical protein
MKLRKIEDVNELRMGMTVYDYRPKKGIGFLIKIDCIDNYTIYTVDFLNTDLSANYKLKRFLDDKDIYEVQEDKCTSGSRKD